MFWIIQTLTMKLWRLAHGFTLALTWSLLLWLLLGVDMGIAVKWLAIHRAQMKVWVHAKNCSRRLGLVRQQLKQCRDNLDLMSSVARASAVSVKTCQNQFSERRWNCSSILLLPDRPKDLIRGTREKAYVYGIASAALMHTVARDCSLGISSKCSCGLLPNTPPAGNFKWGGCGDDVHFGAYFCKLFTDPTLKARKSRADGKLKASTKTLMDQHNFSVGREVINLSLVTACKCHGVSGSCSIKTCWRALPDFQHIGAHLRTRYAFAVEVKRRRRNKELALVPIEPGRKTFQVDELVYYAKSPDYCYPDAKTGSIGTKGRLCDPKAQGSSNCGPMCCGRGADNYTLEVTERCECKYYWCCYVKCKVCPRILHLSKCN